MSTDKQLGQRSQVELEALFGDMYYGWDRGLVITQERRGNGDTKFEERPMTALELSARFVAAEIGINIFEIANRAAFAPITVFSQIQARIGPVFDAMEAEITKLRAERDAAARDMRERCKAVADADVRLCEQMQHDAQTADIASRWAVCKQTAEKIGNAIAALPDAMIATDQKGGAT